MTFFACLLLIAASPVARAPLAPPAAQPGDVEHGKLTWFQGSYDALIAEARKSKKLVFLDFWTGWCGWCKRLDKDTFSDAAAVTEMNDLLCYSVDGESETGRPLVERFGVSGFPALLFLEPDGSQRDRINGYLPPEAFVKEVRRIKRGEGTLSGLRTKVDADPKSVLARLEYAAKLKKLSAIDTARREIEAAKQMIARGEGFDPRSVDERWKIAQAFNAAGDGAAFRDQIRAIEGLDPEAKTLVRRRLRLFELVEDFNRQYVERKTLDPLDPLDTGALETFLASETHAELLFAGWDKLLDIHVFLAEEARKRENLELASSHRARARKAGREAWKHCPAGSVAEWGKYLAYTYYEDAEALSEDEKIFAVEVARRALEAAPKSTDHIDMLACALYIAGRREEAIATLEKALALEPDKPSLRERLEEFRR